MTLQELSALYSNSKALELLQAEICRGQKKQQQYHLLLSGLCASAKVIAISSLTSWQQIVGKADKKLPFILYIADNHEQASYLTHDLENLISEYDVSLFPATYRIRQRNHKPDESFTIQRTELLSRLCCGKTIL